MSEIIIKRNGISLFEVVVVVGIVLCLIAIAVPALRFFQRDSDLNNSAEEIINTLRLAQSKTVASEGSSKWGVYFNNATMPHKYTLFKGSSYATREISFDEIHNLPSLVEISAISLGSGNEVVFNKVSGGAIPSGNVVIRLVNETSKTKSVYIDSAGQVSLNSPSTPSDGRVQDSRHVHLDYNANAQDAITLKLIFPDYPADNYNIYFQTYLNADKTEFSWEGIVLVGPDGSKTEQRLKIHTHNLTITVAQFCVHRPLSSDQSYNDKALNIFLDTEELIRYAADERGTTTKGLSIWVEEPDLQ
ncbi:MAG: hypothetical protein COX90_02540 [Candidatus Nealsonbacteria bacterium CG_4_10_14_0_2_um_filter_38_17]|uniref:General secretion pathway GspH domain-containing protein n=1 Tax=Candidatus Nealsonbacteria bacterium CG_4_10_14_0_2_um_filter_38_17 TaxID=1974680 RepID=A0A2M7UXY3_9BACT|nr:MAG: hypothetical protein COX90_02540 [Candidatus Nealsonbacteria bacterium CG_4_10_14_0_2_um_filter_38_17]